MSYIDLGAGSGGGGPFQPLDADLTAIAALAGTGLLARTGPGTWALRNIDVVDTPTVDLTIVNPGGVAGNPTLSAAVIPGGIDHGALADLLADDHTQYLLLAGRTASTNAPVLSTDFHGTITGSLTLGAALRLRTSTATSVTSVFEALTVNDHKTTLDGGIGLLVFDNTLDIDGSLAQPTMYDTKVSGTWTVTDDTNTLALLLNVFDPIIQNPPGQPRNLGGCLGYAQTFPTYIADGAACSVTPWIGLDIFPNFTTANGGTLLVDDARGMDFLPLADSGVSFTSLFGFRVGVIGSPDDIGIALGYQYLAPVSAASVGEDVAFYATGTYAGPPSGVCSSLRSVDPIRTLRHAGAGVFGAEADPTGGRTGSVGLEVQSTTKALLLSRLTTTERDALTPFDGMVIYNDTLDKLQAREAGAWVSFGTGSGTVTSVAGGVGITNTPEPITTTGTVDLDINSLTTETTLAAGDLFPFVDVSVGTTPASQRKVTFGNINAGLVHNSLSGLTTGDPHTQYTLLAGRTGATNDTTLSTDAGGTLYGSAASAQPLNLQSTSHATRSTVNVVDEMRLRTSNTTTSAASTDTFGARLDAANTHSGAGALFGLAALTGTTTQGAANGGTVSGIWFGTLNNPYRVVVPTNGWSAEFRGLEHRAVIRADGATGVGAFNTGFNFQAEVDRINSGTITGGSLTAIVSDPTVGTGCTLDTYTGLSVNKFAGGGAVTTQRGIRLLDLSNATTNITLESDSTTASMRHAGRIRLGDTSAPDTTAMLDTVLQSVTIGAASPKALNVFDQALDFSAGTSTAIALMVGDGSTWISSADSTGDGQGGNLFQFNPTIQSSPANTTRTTGLWRGLIFVPSFVLNASSGTPVYTINKTRAVVSAPSFTRSASSGTLSIPEVTGLHDSLIVGTGATVDLRRAVFVGAGTISGTVTTQYGLDVANLTVGTTAAAVHSDMAAGTGKYALKLDGTAQSLFGGKITTYNNVATVANGLPSLVAEIDLTAQGAAIGSTLAYAVPAASGGMYRVSYVATVTRAATTSSTLGGAGLGFQVDWTDADTSVAKLSPAGAAVAAGTNTSLATPTNAANTTAASISGAIVVHAAASSNINYRIGYTSAGGTTMQYNLHIKVERLAA